MTSLGGILANKSICELNNKGSIQNDLFKNNEKEADISAMRLNSSTSSMEDHSSLEEADGKLKNYNWF